MAQFSVNTQPQRFDPTRISSSRQMDNKYVAGVSKVGMLKRTTEVVKHAKAAIRAAAANRPAAPNTRRLRSNAA